MAKQYEEFKKTYIDIQKRVAKAQEEINKNANAIAQTSGVMLEGVKEIGLRVQKLKDLGNKGSTIDEFLFDNQVKTMKSSVDAYMKQIKTECDRIGSLHSGSFAATKKLFWETKNQLDAEIKGRKKQVSTKLGVGNKSLPDLLKLQADMNKYKDAAYAKFEVFEPETAKDHERQLDNRIKETLSKTREMTLSAFQKEMDEQACNIRVLGGNVNRAKRMLSAVQVQEAAGEKAFKAKNLKQLMDAKLAIVKESKELADMAAKYDRVKGDSWVMTKINSSKDKTSILGGMKSIGDMRDAAKRAVNKLAAMRL